jgi:phosphatidylserine/phosphatidylglycerophosphate/cardiolipin synthase-like enzyme
MRKRVSNGGVTVQAVAGNHAVFFGLNLDPAARDGVLGFSVHRIDHDPVQPEQYWLSGFKTFRSVVPQPDAKTFYSTRDHPIQSFYWSDYTAKPGHDYTYRFVPRYGTAKNLQDRDGVEATLDISTNDPAVGVHGVYFNRGVAASQAYANKFGRRPDHLLPEKKTEAYEWLSRGLAEALVGFIGQATSSGHALRAAVYEFTEPSVLAAFKNAHDAGADVRIVYHASADETGNHNRTAIGAAKIPDAILIERTNAKIAHNKFIVFCTKDASGVLSPKSVWTGSTNLSEGGIFGHSNVGHEVRDPAVAAQFLGLWAVLEPNPETSALRDWTSANSRFDAVELDTDGIHTLFSPRHGLAPLDWYANRFGAGTTSMHITAAFGLGTIFETSLGEYTGRGLHYVLLDKRDNNQEAWSGNNRRIFVSVGSRGGPNTLARWAQEHLTGFNPRVPYLHTKVLMVDPLGANPTIITGSANFSPASTNANDENMLVIRGDTEVADVYFTEFSRIFNHFYARYWASELEKQATGEHTETSSFLDETAVWVEPYFTPGFPKFLQREFFSSGVQGNV